MYKKIIFGILAIITFAIIAVFASSVSSVSAGPLMDDPTPTPIITYWKGSTKQFSWDRATSTAGATNLEYGWYLGDGDGGGDAPDLIAPDDNYPAGILLTLHSVSYTGDVRLMSGTNTDFAQKFNDNWTGGADEMTPGETICIGTFDACDSQGYTVNASSDWEGYGTNGATGETFITDLYIGWQLGGTTGTVSYSIQPIFYGEWDCEPMDPDDREKLSTGLLLGDDEEGETFQLTPGQQYVLLISGGPWNDGTDDRYDVAVRFKTDHTVNPPTGEWSEWVAIDSVPGDDVCSTEFLEENESVLVFTAELPDQAYIQFRVNDTDDEFDDNTGDVEYYWMGGEGSSQSCNNLWTPGDKVAGATITETNIVNDYIYRLDAYYSGGEYDGLVAPHESYMYKVTGTFLDNGTESGATIVKAGASGEEWTDPADAFLPTVDQCTYEDSETGDSTYFGTTVIDWDPDNYGVPGSHPYGAINDSSGSFADNSGSITLEWYEADWTAPVSTCASKYSIGSYIESPTIFADYEDGLTYPMVANGLVVGQSYYLMQTANYYKDGERSWDFEVRSASTDDWTDPELFFDCVTDLDQNRKGYYWSATYDQIQIRATQDETNVGSIAFNLYGAIPESVPDGEDCSDYYDLTTLVWHDSFSADSNTGYPIDESVFDTGTVYAIKITDSYTEPDGTGKTGQIRRSAPGMGSVEWEDMADWSGALCTVQNDGYDWVYFKASSLSDYEIRAHTPTGNTGTLGFEVWSTDQIKNTVLGCQYDYDDIPFWYVVKQGDSVYANNKGVETDSSGNITAVTGYVLANSFTENSVTYKIETDYLPGHENEFPVWDLQISTDGGKTWIFLKDFVDCWVDLGTPQYRGYFSTPVSGTGPYILRVYDVGGVYLDNALGVNIDMWVDSQTLDPGDIWTNPYDEQSWGTGCYAKCVRPSFLQVGEWVEYARCRFSRWIAWCPKQAKEMEDLRNAFMSVEPFKTINDLIRLGGDVRSEVKSYSWSRSGDSGGGDSASDYLMTAPQNFLFAPGEGGGGVGFDDNWLTGPETIWGSGEIDLSPTNNSYNFTTSCNVELAEVMGTRMSMSLCFAFNVMDQLGVTSWFQFIWDGLMYIAFIMYLKKNWIDKMQ